MKLSGVRTAVAAFGLGRAAFGVAYLAEPHRGARGWFGEDAARKTAVQTAVRSIGARDLVLGGGAAYAATFARDGAVPMSWLIGHAVSDTADAVGSQLAGGGIPESGRRWATIIAAGSAILSAGLAVAVRGDQR